MPFLQFKVGFADLKGKVEQIETPSPSGYGEKRQKDERRKQWILF
jgi:hypothetical protein